MRKTSAKQPDSYDRAIAHAEAVQVFDGQIEAELDRPRPDHRKVARLNAKIGVGLKLAEVYATLAVAEATRAPLEVGLDVDLPQFG